MSCPLVSAAMKMWDSLPRDAVLNTVYDKEVGLRRCMTDGICPMAEPPAFENRDMAMTQSKYRDWSTWRQATLYVHMNQAKGVTFVDTAKAIWLEHVKTYLHRLCKQNFFQTCICALPTTCHEPILDILPLPLVEQDN